MSVCARSMRGWRKAARIGQPPRRAGPRSARNTRIICTPIPPAAAQALGGAGRVEEAEALLAEAIERFPEERSLLHQYASLATQRRDWPEAMRRWDMVIDRDPEIPMAMAARPSPFALRGAAKRASRSCGNN